MFDVGANTGQFAYYSRKLGYINNIYSFEPLKQEFEILSCFAKNDPQWKVYNMAIGDFDGEIEMNVASNSQSSSILNMTQAHINSAPDSAYKGKQKWKSGNWIH
ncbi:MAG: FkbM family methyltransferase [Bacteroidales bacterium]